MDCEGCAHPIEAHGRDDLGEQFCLECEQMQPPGRRCTRFEFPQAAG
jgi:hypothetical protein